jgi:MFS family permease
VPSPYRALFAAPGSKGFTTAGLLGRMPLSMMGIGVVTMISQLTGRYGLAGSLAATIALSAAVLGPQISRLVDQHGQRPVLRPATLFALTAAAGLLPAAHFDWPDWVLFVCSAGIGCVPSIGAMTRARWAFLYRDRPELHTAYAFESVIDEVCFIFGPIISIGLSTVWFPVAGPLLAGCFLAVGVFWLTSQRATEPPPHPREHHAGGSALRSAGLQVLVATFVATGAIFGAVDVVTVAFAEEQGHKGAASIVLAVHAAGSCVAGAVFGLLRFTGGGARPQVGAGDMRHGREYDPPPTGRKLAVPGRGAVRCGPVHRADDDHDDGPRRTARTTRETDRGHDLGEHRTRGRGRARLLPVRLGDRHGRGAGRVRGSGGGRSRRGRGRFPRVSPAQQAGSAAGRDP